MTRSYLAPVPDDTVVTCQHRPLRVYVAWRRDGRHHVHIACHDCAVHTIAQLRVEPPDHGISYQRGVHVGNVA